MFFPFSLLSVEQEAKQDMSWSCSNNMRAHIESLAPFARCQAASLLSAARLAKLIACSVLLASLFPKTARQCVGGSAAREISVSIIPDRHQGISGTGGARLPKRMASWCVDRGVGVRGYAIRLLLLSSLLTPYQNDYIKMGNASLLGSSLSPQPSHMSVGK